MSIETVRLSERAKQQLITLKRRTGIENWNVLCRWALCLSLAERSEPPDENIPSDSSVEMTWRTFGGPHHEVYRALIRQRAQGQRANNTEQFEVDYFRRHLHRGVSYLLARTEQGQISSLFQFE